MCVAAHQRVTMTRDHVIIRYPDHQQQQQQQTPVSNRLQQQQPGQHHHPHFQFDSDLASSSSPILTGSPAAVVGSSSTNSQIGSDVLRVYADAVEKAKADCEKYVRLAKLGQSQIEETKGNVEDMERKISHTWVFIC